MNSFIGLVTYIFNEIPGVKFFLSEKLSQDPLESFFGKQRMHGGSNDNPTVQAFLHGTNSIRAQSSASLSPVRGNCRYMKRRKIIVDPAPLPKRKRTISNTKKNGNKK